MQNGWFKFLWSSNSNVFLMALVPCKIDHCLCINILNGKTSQFSFKIPNFEFCKLEWCGSNFHWYSGVVVCFSPWVWYFRDYIYAVVIKMANSLISLSCFLIWIRIGIFVWIQLLEFVFSKSFPKHPLAHFSEFQTISGNYSSVIAIIVARKFIENKPQGVLWWNQLCWVPKLVI
jgi:hypothetical protein